MKTIYAVSSGSYSDYRIDALFSSKKLAEDFMATVKDNDYNNIEEYQLAPPTADLIRRGYSVWRVHMLKDGTTEHVERTDNEKYYIIGAGGHAIWERTKAPAYKGKGIPDILTSTVWAKTEKQAIKIVNEKRVQMIADGKFI
jgi:hypothetical protein